MPERFLAGAKSRPSLVLCGEGASTALWGAQPHLWTLSAKCGGTDLTPGGITSLDMA